MIPFPFSLPSPLREKFPFPFLLPSPLRGRRAGDEGAERDELSSDEMRWVVPLSP
jgi:hypothetical protein